MNIKQRIKKIIFSEQNLLVHESVHKTMHEPANPYSTIWRDLTKEEIYNINFVKDYTMTSVERLVTLSRSIEFLIENNIEGDIVECGVWRGGSMMLVANKLLELKSIDKKIYLFDTFEGMSEPGDKDVAWDKISAEEKLYNAEKYGERNVWCYSTLEEVKNNLNKTAYPENEILYVQGKVEDTLPHSAINKISLLRLDTDWYESTKHELECLYDKLEVGGILIIDDYGHWEGAKKAVDEFIQKRKLKLFLNRIDYTGRLAVKISQD